MEAFASGHFWLAPQQKKRRSVPAVKVSWTRAIQSNRFRFRYYFSALAIIKNLAKMWQKKRPFRRNLLGWIPCSKLKTWQPDYR
jgi:hypothetical protein